MQPDEQRRINLLRAELLDLGLEWNVNYSLVAEGDRWALEFLGKAKPTHYSRALELLHLILNRQDISYRAASTDIVLTNVFLFVGPSAYHGFQYGKVYLLRYSLLADNKVAIQLNHLAIATEPVQLTKIEFEQWFLPVLGK